jgi:hypothetical protein
MIRITVALHSAVDPNRNRTLGTLDICNDATGTDRVGNYHGTLHAEYTRKDGRKGSVTQFNRRSQSVWSLVGAFLKMWGHTGHSPKHLHKDDSILPDNIQADPCLALDDRREFARGFFCAVAVLLKETCAEGCASTEAKDLFNQGGDWRNADPEDIETFKLHCLIDPDNQPTTPA